MVRGKKQWLKPGDLRTKKLTKYEKQRNNAVQPKCATAREKEIRVEVDDDVEYNPSESEDDNDDESLGSFDREMAPGLRLRSHSRPLTPTPEERIDPPSEEVGTQPLPPHNVQPEDELAASSIVVPIPEQFRAPVRDNASKLVSKIGIELPDLCVRRWKKVNVADKEPMIQRLAFDLQGNRTDVAKALDTVWSTIEWFHL
ncbi:hypothetical protein HYC85_029409 [Camellia sinensis]|uniref:Uncharacterized protein n=1 Tax=Camellia sinensis TaxID=4442 RepID=A0A7J7G0C3_CAMSI|nr:hypothetical protein HYC85_029409 [Camellia sinensis]